MPPGGSLPKRCRAGRSSLTWPVCPAHRLAAAEELGLHAEHALALPGRCAPQTAGALIAQTVLAILEERDPDERSTAP